MSGGTFGVKRKKRDAGWRRWMRLVALIRLSLIPSRRPPRAVAVTFNGTEVFPFFDDLFTLQARATGMSAQQVVYPGVRRACFIVQARRSPARPALAICTVPRP